MIKLSPYLRRVFKTYGEPLASEYKMPVFVTGCMRSGTTLLVDKLSSHPQLLKIGVELNDVWTQIGGANIVGDCEFKTRDDADNIYTYQMSNYIRDFINESKSLKRHLMRYSVKLKNNTGRVSYDWDNIIPINKSPHLMNKIDYVDKLFPNSKFIIIVRDIYGYSASMKLHFDKIYKQDGTKYYYPDNEKSCWSSNILKEREFEESKTYPSSFETIPMMWFRQNKLAIDSCKNLKDNQYLFVSYENLFIDQKATLSKILEFLNLNKKHKSKIRDITLKKAKIINSSTKGSPLEKWKKSLNDSEINIIKKCITNNVTDYNKIQSCCNKITNSINN